MKKFRILGLLPLMFNYAFLVLSAAVSCAAQGWGQRFPRLRARSHRQRFRMTVVQRAAAPFECACNSCAALVMQNVGVFI